MPWTNEELYKAATGSFPTSGQRLKTVLGAVSGDRCKRDWGITAWNFSGTEPSQSPFGGGYPDGETFNLGINFTQGAWVAGGSGRTAIKRTGAVLGLSVTGPQGCSGSLTTNSVVGASSGSSVGITIQSPLDPSTAGIDASADFASGSVPPPGSGTQDVRFEASIEAGGTDSGSGLVDIMLTYTPDNGGFSAQLVKEWNDIPFFYRSDELSDFDFEWHTNSSYTSLHSTASQFIYPSDPLDEVSYWLRYRREGDSTWLNHGEVPWADPRIS